jgi:hypothetical protein
MSVPIHLALIAETAKITPAELASVTGAIQKQLTRDLAPVWGVTATITSFPALEDAPADYLPVLVSDDYSIPTLGLHILVDQQPCALIKHTDTWSLSVSHEVLELCVDPTGTRTMAGPAPDDDGTKVQYLVEVCDPSEAKEFAYSIDGRMVSDFYLPSFFDAAPMPGRRYSFSGAITIPREVLLGGYISWYDPRSDEWFQDRRFGEHPGIHSLGKLDPSKASLRTQVDERTPHAALEEGISADSDEWLNAERIRARVTERAQLRAVELHEFIAGLAERKENAI